MGNRSTTRTINLNLNLTIQMLISLLLQYLDICWIMTLIQNIQTGIFLTFLFFIFFIFLRFTNDPYDLFRANIRLFCPQDFQNTKVISDEFYISFKLIPSEKS